MTSDKLKGSARITIASEVADFPKVIAFLERFAVEQNLPADTLHSVTLCLDEVVSNIASYAYPIGKPGPITIELERHLDRLAICIRDQGAPFDPLNEAKEPDLDAPLETREIGGLGIHFVKTLMDNVGYVYQAGENQLQLEKNL